jgi:hypothetical protein
LDCGNQLEHQIRKVQWGAKNPNFPYNTYYNLIADSRGQRVSLAPIV